MERCRSVRRVSRAARRPPVCTLLAPLAAALGPGKCCTPDLSVPNDAMPGFSTAATLHDRSTTAPDEGPPGPRRQRPPAPIGRALAGTTAGLALVAIALASGASMAQSGPAAAQSGPATATAGADPSTADLARREPAPADREAGRRLLAQYQCGRCHRIPGVEAATGDLAVPLDRLGRRAYLAGRVPNTPRLLAAWLVRPDALVPGTAMPDLGVSDEHARLMAGYLGTLR